MTKKLISHDDAQPIGKRLPVGVRSDLAAQFNRKVITPMSAGFYSAAGSFALQIVGDSTGNEDASTTPEWVYKLAQKIATAYPGFDVRYIGWDDTTQLMKPVERIGAAPATLRYVDFPGGNSQRASWAAPAITGDIDVQVQITPNSWASGAEQVIVACHSSTTDRSWYLALTSGGQLSWNWSTDGSAVKTAVLSGAWTPAATQWVRARFDVDNGAGKTEIKLYSSTDGATWTQLGSTLTRGQIDAPFAAVGGYQLGERGPTTSYYLGKIHEVRIRDGLDGAGKLVAPALPEHWTPQQYCTGGQGTPVFTVVNGSHPGADLAFLADTARLGKMTPNYGQVQALVSASHNEGFYHGVYSTTRLQALADAIQVRLPACPLGVVGQNPRVSPAPYITPHAQRRTEWFAYARAKGWVWVDAYKAITDAAAIAGTPLTDTSLTKADGVHPQPTASGWWADEAFAALGL